MNRFSDSRNATMSRSFEPSETQAGLQAALVPPVLYSGNFIEAFGRSQPKDEVGGDLADLVAHGDNVIAYVMDVSGHGLRAGVLMGMAKTAFRYGLLLAQPPEKLLRDINTVLGSLKERNMYLTLSVARFSGTGEVEYISAGHLPLLQYEQRTDSVIRHSMSQFPLGLLPDVQYESKCLSFRPGDLFALVTDGVTETGEDLDTERGLEQVSETLLRLHDAPLPDIVSEILGKATEHSMQHDDATVLLLRCSDETGGYQREKAELPLLQEAIWNRQLDALKELLDREDRQASKNSEQA
jgi:sigma-B regulation protein RsbU (phosphoserine phosphatase)